MTKIAFQKVFNTVPTKTANEINPTEKIIFEFVTGCHEFCKVWHDRSVDRTSDVERKFGSVRIEVARDQLSKSIEHCHHMKPERLQYKIQL